MWRIRIDAITSGGRARVGTILTAPPSSARLGVRAVAIACYPGALAWDVFAEPVALPDGTLPPRVGALLKLECSEEASAPGVLPLDGSILLGGAGPGMSAGAYRHRAGTAPDTVAIPAGSVVRSYSASAGTLAATVVISSPIFGVLDTITVPPGRNFSDKPDNLIAQDPAATLFTFAGDVVSWFVGWRELVG